MHDATAGPATDHDMRERLTHSLHEMVDGAEELLKSAQQSGSEQFATARDRLELRLRDARSELAALEQAAARSVRRGARAADSAVHAHPYVTAGVAAGVGALIGLLVARR